MFPEGLKGLGEGNIIAEKLLISGDVCKDKIAYMVTNVKADFR